MKDNMFAPVMYLACCGFSYCKADPDRITGEVFDSQEIDRYVRGSKRSKKREYPMDWVFDFFCDLLVPVYYVTHRG